MAYSNLYARFYVLAGRAGTALAAVWHLPPSRWYLAAIGGLQIIAWLESFFIYHNLADNLLVLHYNVDFGIDLVGAAGRIFFYPLIGLGILALNAAVAAALYRQKDFRIFVHFLFSAALVFAIFLDLALFFVYLINFR
ncbi:MAG: hypothetical protein WC456_02255 [Patescibacteria group bacterium]